MSDKTAATALVEQAEAAFARADWAAARELYEAALDAEPTPAIRDRLGQANWWLDEHEAGMELRSQAFSEFERAGDAEAAANIAVYFAAEYRIAGNASLANGWLGRGERLLEGVGDCSARGWYEIELTKRSSGEEAEGHARAALDLARRIGDSGLEACAFSHLGLALISQGRLDDALAALDESMAIATGVDAEDLLAVGDACCTTLVACEQLADPARARDWGQAISEFTRRRNFTPLSRWCRAVYGGFLVASGQWDEGERELETSLAETGLADGPRRIAPLANLATLRLRQGRVGEAEQLLSGIEDRPAAIGPTVLVHIERGELDLARQKVERRLAEVADSDPRSPFLLGLRARVEIAAGDGAAAAESAQRMDRNADLAERPDLAANAVVLGARAAGLRGETAAPAPLEAAVERLAELGLPLEEGEARLELARALAGGSAELAVEQARAALSGFERLGAARHADEAAALLRDLGAPGRSAPRSAEALTRRERQVLELLGEGLSNPEIAERLVISPRTAEHHVARVLSKLDLRNRAEAAAYAAREGGTF